MDVEGDVDLRLVEQPEEKSSVVSDRGELVGCRRVPLEVVNWGGRLRSGQKVKGEGAPHGDRAVSVVSWRHDNSIHFILSR